jgi:multiple sugar transport system permease protein
MKYLKSIQLSRGGRKAIRLTISYIFLTAGALFMLFPVFWMVTAALKPEWQIFIRPIIWIPQHWHKTPAGETVRALNLWEAPNPANGREEVIEVGSRRYSPAIAASQLPDVIAAPEDEVGESETLEINGVTLNVRDWKGQRVVALSKEGDNLIVVPADALADVRVMPLDQINAGDRERVEVNGYEFRVRRLEMEGETLDLLTLGPQTQLKTVTGSEAAQYVERVYQADIVDSETLPLGQIEIEQYTLADRDGRYALIDEADWRPTLDIKTLSEHAFSVLQEDIEIQEEPIVINQCIFTGGTYTDDDGTTQEVAIVLREEIQTDESVLVMPVSELESVQLVPSASLQRPFPETVAEKPVRVKDFTLATVKDETIDMDRLPDRVAILGERQDMALVIPSEHIKNAYDVPGEEIRRQTSISFMWKNFLDAMQRELAGANFVDFFRNSIIITALSIVGHLFSCTMVAYAFARMRAPGKNFLFTIILGTMMLPGFVTLVPVYKIFRDLGWIDTLAPLIVPSFFGNAFLIFLLRQFFSTIPMELEEAALIDGASRLQIFVRIMLPLITPALATVMIFTFLWRWNDLFSSAIYLNSPENYTVGYALKQFIGAYEAEFNLLMAASTIVMLPTVILFFFAQRFFIEGITLTGMKG